MIFNPKKIFGVLILLALGGYSVPSKGAELVSDSASPKAKLTERKKPSKELAKQLKIKKTRRSALAKGEITFDDLKFDIKKDQLFKRKMLTKAIEDLHGKTIQLRGFILPSTLFTEKNIKEFVLVRDNQECCFGPGAALFDCVIINMVEGVTTDFTTRPVTVKGKFRIKEFTYPDGIKHFAVFHIEGTQVK